MHNSYVLIINNKNKVCTLDILSPEVALYSSILGSKEFGFYSTEYNILKDRISLGIDTLTDTERKIILYRFGFMDNYYSLRSTGKEVGLTGERVRQIELKALRKLRHYSRFKKFKSYYKRISSFLSNEKEKMIDYKTMIINEIIDFLSYNNDNICFFDIILKKNNFEIILKYDKYLYTMPIRELDLSHDTFSIEQAGINTIGELINSIYDESKWANIQYNVEDIVEELFLKIYEITGKQIDLKQIREEKYTPIEIIHNGSSKTYMLKKMTIRETAECVFEILTEEYSNVGSVLDFSMSKGLLYLLLINGHFYINSIIDDQEKIENEFKEGGYEKYVAELNSLIDKIKIYLDYKSGFTVNFIKIDKTVADKIIKNNPTDALDLIDCLSEDDIGGIDLYDYFGKKSIDTYRICISDNLNKYKTKEQDEIDDNTIIAACDEDY